MMIKLRKLKLSSKILVVMALSIMLVFGISINSEAITIATRTWDLTTFQGSIVYKNDSGPSGHFDMTLSATRNANFLYESVTLKSKNGVERKPIKGAGLNSNSITIRTNTFADGYYTMRGYYFYSLETYLGNKYTFSDTY
ncbi:MAG: hypothetical protein ACI4D8_07965 [Wujia sp.]